MTRIELMMAIIETPTSANTAAHIETMPKAPNSKKKNLTASEKTMFSQTIFRVLLAILIVVAIFDGSSVIMTISAASIAASLLPKPPIAIPTSARANTARRSVRHRQKNISVGAIGAVQQFEFGYFYLRKQFGIDRIDPQLLSDCFADAMRIAGKHDGVLDSQGFKVADGLWHRF